MALVKTVEMRILAKAGDAQAKLDELDAKAKDLDGNAIRMRFRVDDAGGKAQLDAIRARADLLGFKDVSIKVKVDGAGRAIADLMAVRREEDKVGGGIGGRIGGGLDKLSGLGGGGGVPLPLAGGMPLPALLAALPVIAAGAAAALVEVTGLASGFAAAGAGAGAFALLAVPAVRKVEAALKDTPAKLAKLKLSPDEAGAVAGIRQLEGAFGKISTAFQPQAFKVFNDGLKLANSLLPHVTPFAATFATSLDKLLQRAGKFTQSKGFADFLKQFQGISGPATTAIGTGIGNVANAFGKLMTVMSGKDVAHAINIAFGGISGTIRAVAASVRFLMTVWDGMGIAAHNVASAFDRIRHSLAGNFGHQIAQDFDSIRHGAAAAAGAVVSFFSGLPGKIRGIFGGAIGWLTSAGGNIVRGLGAGARAAAGAVTAWFGSIKGTVTGFFSGAGGWLVSAGKAIIQGLIDGIGSMVGAVGSAISSIAGTIRSFLPFSPARQGPLSGAGSPELAGRQIAVMLARGMDYGQPGVAQAAGRMAGAAAGAAGMAGSYGWGGTLVVHNEFHGITNPQDAARQVVQVLREYKRHGGGAPLGLT
jgi:hypothetical protein